MRGKKHQFCRYPLKDACCNSFVILFVFFCSFTVAMLTNSGKVFASNVEILSPRSGATVISRKAEVHLILRCKGEGKACRLKVEKSGRTLNPIVDEEEDRTHVFLHFRLPLVPGKNRFSIVPGNERIELTFKPIFAELDPNSIGPDVFLFHQQNKLPKSCQGCHDLEDTGIIQPIGLRKETSCVVCHKNLVEETKWPHSPSINGQCLLCHQQTVKGRIGFPIAKLKDLCFACHTSKKSWYSQKYVHGPLNAAGCTLCHDPHGQDYPDMLWADGSMALCLVCHRDLEDLVSKNNQLPFVHGIIVGKGCVACHDPHASDQEFMLLKPINELCVSCHTFLAGVKRGHPVEGHPLSGPEEKRRKGRRLGCTGCHDPHGSRHKHLLIKSTMGGQLCYECHHNR